MGQLDTLLKATIGGTGVDTSFQLEDYTVNDKPIYRDQIGEVGREVMITCEGWIESSSAAAFASDTLTVHTRLRLKGQDFKVFGLSGVECYALLAAHCVEGGPNIDFEQMPQLPESPLRNRFRLTVKGKTISGTTGGGGGVVVVDPTKGFHETVAKGPDGLRTVTRSGEFTSPNGAATFLATYVPAFRGIYPLPDWTLSRTEYEYDDADKIVKYTIAASELREPLPGGADVVGGEVTASSERDEQKRLVKVISVDLLLSTSNYQPVLDTIRANVGPANTIVRERASVTTHREVRLTATFETLSSAEGNRLANWNQSIRYLPPANVWTQMRHPGCRPFLLLHSEQLGTIVQSGRAVGIGARIIPPDPLFPDVFASTPVHDSVRISDFEFETTWAYEMFVETFNLQNINYLLNRPANPLLGS